MRKALLTLLPVLALGAATPSRAQSDAPDCNFSSHKPLVVSHALLNAVVKRVKPEYPATAMTVVRSDAVVHVRILVDREGNVAEACVVQGHPLLRAASRNAALQWKFARNFGFSVRQRRKYIRSDLVFTFRFNARPRETERPPSTPR